MSNLLIAPEHGELSYGDQYDAARIMQHTPRTAMGLYGIFVEILRGLYHTTQGRQYGAPACVWRNDPAKTELWIDTELRWEDEYPEFRPAIYVKLDELRYESLTGRKDGLVERDSVTGAAHYERAGAGVVSFVHVGHTAGEACGLADVTHEYMDAFNRVLRCDFGFHEFHPQARVALAPAPKESKDRKESIVSFQFMFVNNWTIQTETPHLKNITFSAGQSATNSGIL